MTTVRADSPAPALATVGTPRAIGALLMMLHAGTAMLLWLHAFIPLGERSGIAPEGLVNANLLAMFIVHGIASAALAWREGNTNRPSARLWPTVIGRILIAACSALSIGICVALLANTRLHETTGSWPAFAIVICNAILTVTTLALAVRRAALLNEPLLAVVGSTVIGVVVIERLLAIFMLLYLVKDWWRSPDSGRWFNVVSNVASYVWLGEAVIAMIAWLLFVNLFSLQVERRNGGSL